MIRATMSRMLRNDTIQRRWQLPRWYTVWLRFLLTAAACTPLMVGTMFAYPYVFVQSHYFYILVLLATVSVAFFFLASSHSVFKSVAPQMVIAGLFLFALAVSAFAGVSTHKSIWGTWERFGGVVSWVSIIAYWLLLQAVITSVRQWLLLFRLHVYVSSFVALYALAQAFGAPLVFASGIRVFGTLGNPGFLAGYLLLTIAMTLSLVRREEAVWFRIALCASALVQFAAIILSGTRAAIFGIAVGGVMYTSYRAYNVLRNRAKVPHRYLSNTAVSLLVLGTVFSFLFVSRPETMSEGLTRLNVSRLFNTTTVDRLQIWHMTFDAWRERPFLGWGENNFLVTFQRYYDPFLYKGATHSAWFDRSHNEFLDRLVMGGIIGLCSYLLWLLMPFQIVLRKSNSRECDKEKQAHFLLTAGLISYIVYLAFYFHSVADTIVFATISAHLVSLKRLKGDPFENESRGVVAIAQHAVASYFVCLALGTVVLVYGPVLRLNYLVRQASFMESPAAASAAAGIWGLQPEADRVLAAMYVEKGLLGVSALGADAGSGDRLCLNMARLSRRYPYEVEWLLVYANASINCTRIRSFSDAERLLTAAIQLAPRHPYVRHARGLAYLNMALTAESSQGYYLERARESFAEARQLAPYVFENELFLRAVQAVQDASLRESFMRFAQDNEGLLDSYSRQLTMEFLAIMSHRAE